MTIEIDEAKIIRPNELDSNDINHWNLYLSNDRHLSSPFYSYYFSLAAETAGMNVKICILYSQNEAIAFIPFQFQNRLNRILKVADRVGGNLNDYFGIIAKPGVYLSQKDILSYCDLNYFSYNHLLSSQESFGLTGEKPEPSPIVNFAIGEKELNSKQRKKINHFKKETERRLNRTVKEIGEVRFEFSTPNIKDELKRCIKYKRMQYKNTNSFDPLKHNKERELLNLLSNMNDFHCKGVLSTLYAGDQWLASHFGLINESTMHYWFPVYNPDFTEYSAGRILTTMMIEESFKKGVKYFDFGAGSSQMKMKFANDENIVVKGVWRKNSMSGLTFQVLQSVKWKYNSVKAKISQS